MSYRKRKHGIFAVNGEVFAFSSNKEEARRDCLPISAALDTIFNQMRIAGNSLRTIESYEYISRWRINAS